MLETDQALVRTPPAHILQSFVRDHGNVIVNELFEAGKIGELAKLPGGNLRLLVTEEEACQKIWPMKKLRFSVTATPSEDLIFSVHDFFWIFSEFDRKCPL